MIKDIYVNYEEKMKKAIEAERSPQTQAVKKGVSGVTKDELELLQNIFLFLHQIRFGELD